MQGGDQERRGGLRRLDDILESLEQLNLHDKTELPDHVAEALVMLGIEQPHAIAIPKLIESVWARACVARCCHSPARRLVALPSPWVPAATRRSSSTARRSRWFSASLPDSRIGERSSLCSPRRRGGGTSVLTSRLSLSILSTAA